jgi:hypothetical protein
MYQAANNLYGKGGCDAAYIGGGGVCGSYCDTYCDLAMKLCTGDDQLFAAADTCELACSSFPTDGDTYEYYGDSVQCRLNHFVGSITSPEIHCSHSSPAGGGKCE